MVSPSLANAFQVDANLREAMRCYSQATAAGEVREYPGIVVTSSGLDYSVFNSAMLTSPVENELDLDRRLAMAGVHYAARGVGWSCWVCEDQLTLVLKRCDVWFAKYGLHLLTTAPGMIADPILPVGRRTEVECRRVHDARTQFDFADVACVVFLLPFRVSEAIYGQPGYWSSGMRGYVAYWRDKPVAVVSTVLAAGAVGVYSLGTLPQHQRRGIGETLLRYALEDTFAATGVNRTVLQSTQAGLSLYRKMGFRNVTRFRIYDLPGGVAR
jgi:ribosomal protein S18 acetylase RimI-like enzyme